MEGKDCKKNYGENVPSENKSNTKTDIELVPFLLFRLMQGLFVFRQYFS